MRGSALLHPRRASSQRDKRKVRSRSLSRLLRRPETAILAPSERYPNAASRGGPCISSWRSRAVIARTCSRMIRAAPMHLKARMFDRRAVNREYRLQGRCGGSSIILQARITGYPCVRQPRPTGRQTAVRLSTGCCVSVSTRTLRPSSPHSMLLWRTIRRRVEPRCARRQIVCYGQALARESNSSASRRGCHCRPGKPVGVRERLGAPADPTGAPWPALNTF